MRVSTSTIYDLNVSQMSQQQSDLLNTQLHISSGKRVMTPADDPVAAAQAVLVSQADATNTQFTTNRNAAQSALGQSETVLQSVTTLIQNIQTQAVSAGNGSLNNTDRQSIATSVQGMLDQLYGLANSKDSSGNYLFSGSQGGVTPFAKTATGATYNGDDVQHLVQVAASRQISVNDSGADIFMRVKNGNGVYAASAPTTNTGTGVISPVSQISPPPTADQLRNSYTITFSTSGGSTTYSITGTDASGAALPTVAQPGALPTNVAYSPGQAISFNGIQFNIQGTPANGDTFSIVPSSNVSVFQTVTDLITALNTPIQSGNAAATANYNNQLTAAMTNLDQALNKVLTVRASVGARLNELTSLQSTGDALGLQYKQQLSNLQDLDYNKALSTLSQQQTSLQAAQQSFVKVSGLSLFNYM